MLSSAFRAIVGATCFNVALASTPSAGNASGGDFSTRLENTERLSECIIAKREERGPQLPLIEIDLIFGECAAYALSIDVAEVPNRQIDEDGFLGYMDNNFDEATYQSLIQDYCRRGAEVPCSG